MKYQRGPIPANAFDPADLSPQDQDCARFDWSLLQADRVCNAKDPAFDAGYRFLHEEFAPRGEMETREVLEQRLRWDPASPVNGFALLYEMLVVTSQHGIAAVRDHTAIVDLQNDAPAVVHLSHVLVEKNWRGSGLAGWLRTLPIETARGCLKSAGKPATTPIVLAGEMEHPQVDDPGRLKRLGAYERAGFLKIDPAKVSYHQPDFRTPEEIDADGQIRLIPMGLLVRRVGREKEQQLSGREVRQIVSAIYGMFAATFRPQDMKMLWKQLEEAYPRDDALVDLVPPTHQG